MEFNGIILPYNIQNKLYSLLPKSSNNNPKRKPQTKWHKTTVVSTFQLHKKIPGNFMRFFLAKKMSAARKQVPFGPRKAMGAGRGDGTQPKIGTKKPTGGNEPRTQKK